MGTRNLTCVFFEGEYKIAQYGQWDGYPSGQGETVLNFAKSLKDENLDKFKSRLKETRFLTTDEMKAIDRKHPGTWHKHYPHLSRDAGADILDMVFNGVNELKNTIGFAGDSLFCEFCYVIDLDKHTLEAYTGFNREPIKEGRFMSGNDILEKNEEYEPVKLVATYPLDNLPDSEQFCKDVDPPEDEY